MLYSVKMHFRNEEEINTSSDGGKLKWIAAGEPFVQQCLKVSVLTERTRWKEDP